MNKKYNYDGVVIKKSLKDELKPYLEMSSMKGYFFYEKLLRLGLQVWIDQNQIQKINTEE